MAYYYLVSQLPNISASEGKTALPLNTEEFRELASRFISNEEKAVLEGLSLVPPMELTSTGSAFLDVWYEKERNLRFALAQIRAQKLKKDSVPLPPGCTADIISAARTAVGMDSPLSAEEYLNQYRMDTLKSLTPIDGFCVDAIYAYGLKLMLAQRMRLFDVEIGKDSYHKIYDEILGDAK